MSYNPIEKLDQENLMNGTNKSKTIASSKATRKDVLDAYPAKTKIDGAHSDVNRFLKSKGKDAIYEDKDEEKHKNNQDDDSDGGADDGL